MDRWMNLSLLITFSLVTLAGCATKGDLDKLKQELQTSISTFQSDLDKKLTSLPSQIEALKEHTMAVLGATQRQSDENRYRTAEELKQSRAALEATQRQSEEHRHRNAEELKELQETLTKLSQSITEDHNKLAEISAALRENQTKLNEAAAKYDFVAKESEKVHSAVQSARRVVLELLKMEETPPQDRLRSVQSLMKELGESE